VGEIVDAITHLSAKIWATPIRDFVAQRPAAPRIVFPHGHDPCHFHGVYNFVGDVTDRGVLRPNSHDPVAFLGDAPDRGFADGESTNVPIRIWRCPVIVSKTVGIECHVIHCGRLGR